MILRRYIEEWKEFAQWPENAQVEQDLVIERAIVEIFSDKFLNENLALSENLIKKLTELESKIQESLEIFQQDF